MQSVSCQETKCLDPSPYLSIILAPFWNIFTNVMIVLVPRKFHSFIESRNASKKFHENVNKIQDPINKAHELPIGSSR